MFKKKGVTHFENNLRYAYNKLDFPVQTKLVGGGLTTLEEKKMCFSFFETYRHAFSFKNIVSKIFFT